MAESNEPTIRKQEKAEIDDNTTKAGPGKPTPSSDDNELAKFLSEKISKQIRVADIEIAGFDPARFSDATSDIADTVIKNVPGNGQLHAGQVWRLDLPPGRERF